MINNHNPVFDYYKHCTLEQKKELLKILKELFKNNENKEERGR